MKNVILAIGLAMFSLNVLAIPFGGKCVNDNGATKGGCDGSLICDKGTGTCQYAIQRPTTSLIKSTSTLLQPTSSTTTIKTSTLYTK